MREKDKKIERMAWELFKENLLDTDKEPGITMAEAFEIAEDFCNFAKTKEKSPIVKNAAKAIGGKARAKKLTPERRIEIAKKAAKARWDIKAGDWIA